MTGQDTDEAYLLAEKFKKQGYFDKLKQDILTESIDGNGDETLEKKIKETVTDIVKNMVNEEEELIFKNRGTTSALIESKILMDNYKMLSENKEPLNVEKTIKEALQNANLSDDIKATLEKLLDDTTKMHQYDSQ
ncbi:hypothetical protein KAFR_0C04370 [Kazachstania africana CBS 2517]|uniref:BOD1/SHG1 domain-containing protein n=1 Tax=Kazachstania africana (strain ATCC 22294 / BCRC 22015 / CBS 2517 / CECT 1963 / NBRC 1671 / NRRL Y-8276) TaxID=1071382 RepID=H2ASS7_KAZAF|nr:hypothetical protein KAFR_0C04370 [Kazachstania africana CBS 2517]CCF57427.1 hypothetical protein KAFR_0C04370 [Kazachstania africana CBS 2517]